MAPATCQAASTPLRERRWIPAGRARHPALLAAILIGTGVAIGDRFGWSPLMLLLVVLMATMVAALVFRHGRSRVVANIVIAVTLMSLGAWRIAVENSGRPSAALVKLTESTQPVEVFGQQHFVAEPLFRQQRQVGVIDPVIGVADFGVQVCDVSYVRK